MSNLAQTIAKLSPERRLLLEQKLRERGIDVGSAMILPQPRAAGAYPLSYAQRRLWLLDQLDPDSPLYNLPLALHLRGALDVTGLTRALNMIVQRHEALRTTFATRDEEPVQVIAPEIDLTIQTTDLRELPEHERADEAGRLMAEEAQRPFNLARGPLLRADLLRLADDEHIALLTIHHIVADGWSMGVLVHEIEQLYPAIVAGQAAPLPELPIQYVDYAAWQQRMLAGPARERQLAYWKERLSGIPPLLELPTDRPRPPRQSYHGAHQPVHLPADLAASLRALSQAEGATLFMTLLAAYALLLARYSRQDDICVGTPVAGRARAELEPLIGFFVNTLVLRSDLSGAPSFRQLLGRMREATLGAFEHQDLPFELLVEELRPERSLGYNPLFQVMFALQNAPVGELALPGLTIAPAESDFASAKFDLTLMLAEDGGGLSGSLEYNREIFDPPTIARMVGHFQLLLEGVVADPDRPVTQLPLLSAAERHLLLETWNQTAAPFPNDRCAHELFEEQVARAPDAVAVRMGAEQLTYGELNARANQIAHALRSRGVRPETLVAICVERSLAMIVSIFGVLKAGGAYLPLDPTFPSERLVFMLADAQPTALLTTAALAERLGLNLPSVESDPTGNRQSEIEVIYLDHDWPLISAESSANPEYVAGPEDLAYVIYTSGSTGRPKGTLLTHRGLCNLYAAWNAISMAGPGERVLQFFAFGFDGSLLDIFGTLLAGGSLCLTPPDLALPGPELARYMREQGVTVAALPPAALTVLPNDQLPDLHTVISGGESCPAELAASWLPGRRFLNVYGPTETTVAVTWHQVSAPVSTPVPIGRPIANTRLYILDPHGQPTPLGVPGELHIGGVQLARGYLNRPELTAEKFIMWAGAPEMGGPGPQRLYKTGDLARYLPDGAIEYLGRIDHQVKLRGFRIELGEIEAVLRQSPTVHDVAVVVREDVLGDKRLVGYVVLSMTGDTAESAEDVIQGLRSALKAQLPEYMLPAAFVVLEALPLSPSGKVDRRALPAPEWGARGDGDAFIAPRTPTEATLARIWSELLGVAQVGIRDNFFELGGHSLLATRLVSHVRKELQVELALSTVFETPVLEELASRLGQADSAVPSGGLPPIVATPRDSDPAAGSGHGLPLSFAQQRLWFLQQLEPDNAQYHVPNATRLRGPLDLRALEQALQAIVARHEILRTCFPSDDGQPTQLIRPSLDLPVQLIELRDVAADAREEAAIAQATAEATRPFDLASGPLLRVCLIRLDDSDHLLLVTMHHVIADGWSSGVFIRELVLLYTAAAAGQPAALPALPLQYADYAVWQRAWLQGPALEQQLGFWTAALGPEPPVLQLPSDRPRPPVQRGVGTHLPLHFDASLSAQLKALTQASGATLFMTLLTGFAVLLYRYSGQERFAIGTPVANRRRAELEGLIGCFINTLALPLSLEGQPSFRALLARVRESTLAAYEHQDAPFELLVERLQPERDLSHTPIFQAMFILQNAPLQAVQLQHLELEPFPIDPGISPFDLTLVLEEVGDGLAGGIEYSTDLFDAPTIVRMAGHLRELLAAAVASPDQPITSLALLTAQERQHLIDVWSGTAHTMPIAGCLHELFEAQVDRNPTALALVAGTERLSYGELERRANQLAHVLQSHGAGPERLVAIALDRTADLVVAVLAILKAGAAYLPLDLHHPPERLAALLADAQPVALLTTATFSIPGATSTVRLCLDEEKTGIAQAPDTRPVSGVSPENLAYLIYTSGSTGTPKGVLIEHRNLVSAYRAWEASYGLVPGQRHLQMARATFDVFAGDLARALGSGGALVLCPQELLLEPADLAALLRREAISYAEFVPTVLRPLMQHLEASGEHLPDLQLLVCGSDGWFVGEYRHFQQVCGPQIRLINSYGLTETTIDSTYFEAQDLAGAADQLVPIGRPFANTSLYILDQQGQLAPTGVSGELYIGGAGLARGYYGRPDLTAERFVASPFGPGRLYRSGDRARLRSDGNVELLGRADQQLKIRGFRIEPGEIEAALVAHPALQAAAVTSHRSPTGDMRLVAYVVPEQQDGPGDAELRAHLQGRLPDYMVPTAFVSLASLPLSANGKIDRQALPAPVWGSHKKDSNTYTDPHTPAERTLAQIWGVLLGLERVGANDNFFALGGDSILSIQVIARARAAGLQLTPRDLFLAPTVAELARRVSAGPQIQAEQGRVRGPVVLTPIQHWFFEQELPNPNHWNQALMLAVHIPLDRDLLQTVVEHLLAHHDALRMRYTRGPAGWEQHNAEAEDQVAVHLYDLADLTTDAQRQAIEARAEELQASLDLERGPLLCVAAFNLGDGQPGRLLLIAHHLVMDGVSWRILLEDLQSLYEQLSQGLPAQLPPKTTSFQQWAARLADYASSPAALAERDYWLGLGRGHLARLPRDNPQGVNTEGSDEQVVVSLDREATRILLRRSHAIHGAKLDELLLVALAQALCTWSGGSGTLVELEGHGRVDLFDDIDVSRTVGWFTTDYPVLLEPGAPGEAVGRVKEQLRCIPSQGIGYGLLRFMSADPALREAMRALPPTEVSFNYLGQIDRVAGGTSAFTFADESGGAHRSPGGMRSHILDVSASVAQEELFITITYSANIHRRTTIDGVAQGVITALQSIISGTGETNRYIPADFTLAKLDQRKLDKVLAKVGQKKERRSR